MAINPIRFNPIDAPPPPRPMPQVDFSGIAQLGAGIGRYREQEEVGRIMAGATDPRTGALDYNKAITGLGAAGLQKYAEPFLHAQAQREALMQSAAGQTEQTRHNKAIEEAAKSGRVPFGWEPDPQSAGGYRPIVGGPQDPAYLAKLEALKGEKAPAGYRADPDQPGALKAIPGGPGEKIGDEAAARIGLAKNFLAGLNDTVDAQGNPVPGLRSRIQAGEMTGGLVNPAMAWAGYGGPSEVRRKLDSGADALLRNLTGAGMGIQEATDYVRRYRFSPRDRVGESVSKLNQLEAELTATINEVERGRGGALAGRGTPAAPRATAPTAGGLPPLPPGFVPVR